MKIPTVLQIIWVLSKLLRYYYCIYELVPQDAWNLAALVITTRDKHMIASTPTTITWHVPCTPIRLWEGGMTFLLKIEYFSLYFPSQCFIFRRNLLYEDSYSFTNNLSTVKAAEVLLLYLRTGTIGCMKLGSLGDHHQRQTYESIHTHNNNMACAMYTN